VALSVEADATTRSWWQIWWQRAMSAALLLSRSEWALIGLVILAYAYFFSPANTNTLSRYDMVQALAHGTAIIDVHAANTIDVSFYNGHYYSPRSIGLSLIAVPILGVLHIIETHTHLTTVTIQIGLLSMFTVLPAALAGVIAFERLILRLRPRLAGTPIPVVVTGAFALGTLYYSFAAEFLSHAFAGGLLITGFYVLYRAKTARRAEILLVVAGLLVGLSVISEYPTALVVLVFCVYVWASFPGRRVRMLALFVGGTIPWALVLGWYDWFAFGNPFHISYDYVAGTQFVGQHQGLFGITWPHPAAYWEILVWPRGLLVTSPLLALVPIGFSRWWRSEKRPPAEALVCLAVVVIYASLIASYFLPMAGENNPGPRLLTPMLPFACLSLVWVADDARRWVRAGFGVLMAFGVLLAFLWTALGTREFHTYVTYPINDLFLPLLRTGYAPKTNGDTPPNLASLFLHVPQRLSLYPLLVLLAVWVVWALYELWRYRGAQTVESETAGVATLSATT
jgi:4-amino-4-deoxy-L-arabinose transferase-like glycosyltransferase